MRKLLVLLLASTPAIAGDQCFYTPITYCQPYQHYAAPYNYDYDVEKVNFETQYLRISAKKPQIDVEGEKAFHKMWVDVTNAIPIPPAPNVLRTFKFNRNWPTVPAQLARGSSSRELQIKRQALAASQNTQVVTQVLQGVIQQSIEVEGGVTIIQPGPNGITTLTPGR